MKCLELICVPWLRCCVLQNGDGPCGESVKLFADCMSRYHGDMGACQPYFDAMQQCKTRFAV